MTDPRTLISSRLLSFLNFCRMNHGVIILDAKLQYLPHCKQLEQTWEWGRRLQSDFYCTSHHKLRDDLIFHSWCTAPSKLRSYSWLTGKKLQMNAFSIKRNFVFQARVLWMASATWAPPALRTTTTAPCRATATTWPWWCWTRPARTWQGLSRPPWLPMARRIPEREKPRTSEQSVSLTWNT